MRAERRFDVDRADRPRSKARGVAASHAERTLSGGMCSVSHVANVANYLLGGTIQPALSSLCMDAGSLPLQRSIPMNGVIYLVGLIVVILFILSFLGLR